MGQKQTRIIAYASTLILWNSFTPQQTTRFALKPHHPDCSTSGEGSKDLL